MLRREESRLYGSRQVRGGELRLLRDTHRLGGRDSFRVETGPDSSWRGGYRQRDPQPARSNRTQAAIDLYEGQLHQVQGRVKRRGSRGGEEGGVSATAPPNK